MRSKRSGVRFPFSPLRFQRLVISCFQVAIWLKYRLSDINPQINHQTTVSKTRLLSYDLSLFAIHYYDVTLSNRELEINALGSLETESISEGGQGKIEGEGRGGGREKRRGRRRDRGAKIGVKWEREKERKIARAPLEEEGDKGAGCGGC